MAVIDRKGYRPNVGIILCNSAREVFWACRIGRTGWQFPQGGIDENEDPEQAMYRELYEEIGLQPDHIEIVGRTRDWLYYDLPEQFLRRSRPGKHGKSRPGRQHDPRFRGQKQVWFLLKLVCEETEVCLSRSDKPEFEDWQWVHYWQPVEQVIEFKRDVYHRALEELEPFLEQI